MVIHYSDDQMEIKMQQVENDRIMRSWNYLYDNSGKDVKKLMEKGYGNWGQTEND
jgi:hypothetical protein